MKKLQFLALLVFGFFILSAPAYSQSSKLNGKWNIKIAPSTQIGTIEFTSSGSKGVFQDVKGERFNASNIKFENNMLSFNVNDKQLRFHRLAFQKNANDLEGLMIDGKAVGRTRTFAVVFTKINYNARTRVR